MPFLSSTESGQAGEEYICQQLKKRGFAIVDRNVSERFAEIDIVARDKETLVFVEVRTRNTARFGHPAETINEKKQQHIRRAAEAYLVKHGITDTEIRFDVATLIWETMKIDYFENAL